MTAPLQGLQGIIYQNSMKIQRYIAALAYGKGAGITPAPIVFAATAWPYSAAKQ
jgi:hypothetical protein